VSDLPVSRTFLYELDELYTKRRTKEITEEEFSTQRDALFAQEAKSREAMGPALIAKQLEAIEASVIASVDQKFQKEEQEENERVTRERLARIAEQNRIAREEQAKQDAIEAENKKKIDDRDNFRRSVDRYMQDLEQKTSSSQVWLNRLQIILIVLTTATASLAGFDGLPRVYVVIVGFLAASLGGILSFFQLQDKIYAGRKALAELRLECQKYDHRIDVYATRDDEPEKAYLLFSEKITTIQAEQMLQEVELLKPKKEAPPAPTEESQTRQKKEEREKDGEQDASNDTNKDAEKQQK
jgi:hypothetical protein